ncbi:MAG: oligosaccharide flippase family protein [Patescibacteria group bacterium]|nr:oligosaccharide flippase family protein [Patescibacteria group bacterium]
MSKLKTSFIILVIAEFIYNISSYVVNMGLGRMLGVADYGRYSLVIGFTTMIILLASRAIPTAMMKRISENIGNWPRIRAIRRSAGFLQIIIITSLTIIFYILAPLIAQAFNDTTLTPLFRISALVIPAFAISSFHVLYFNGLKYFKAMTAMKIARGIFRIAWIVGLAYLIGLSGAFYGSILAPLSVFVVAIIIEAFFIKDVETHRDASLSTHTQKKETYSYKKIVAYAGGFILFLIFYEFYIRADMYLIKAITGSDINTGLYNAAFTIALIPYYVMFALTFILFPTMSELAKKKDHTQIQDILKKVILLLFVILVPAAIVMSLMPEFLITLFFGNSFIAAAHLIPLLTGGTVFITIFFVLAAVFNGADMTRIPASITAIALTGGIIANIHFLPIYGISATAIIFSCTATFMGLTALFFMYTKFFKVNKIIN